MPEKFDVIVIGGGCNGTGIARDAAMRGLSVLLLEKEDFASGTTGASSGMIHGGPRYLLSERKVTKASSRDAGYIRKIAPHLCFRIPFLYPVFKDGKPAWSRRVHLGLLETFLQAYDRFSSLKEGKPHTHLSREETYALEPSLAPDAVGAVTFDEWGINGHRLSVANALAVREYGGVVMNHTKVNRFFKEGDRLTGLNAHNTLTGEELDFRSKIIVNATGPWAPQIAAMAGVEVRLRPSKGIHLVLDRRITNVAVISKAVDGREIFINPHENTTLLGTTDDDFFGSPDDIPVTADEVEYLLQGMEKSYPEIRKARILTTTRGLRPTLYREGLHEEGLSRDHKIFDHEKENRLKGFLSIAGGKLASYRLLAEEATDLISKKLSLSASCRTHLVPLPGGEEVPKVSEIAETFQIHPYVAERIICRHGSLSRKVLEPTKGNPNEKGIVCPCEPVTTAELRYTIHEEWAQTLGDLKRRTKLGAGACQGTLCLLPAVSTLASEVEKEGAARGGVDILQEMREFLKESWKARQPILRGVGFPQEEMLRMSFLGVLDLGIL